MKIKIEDLYEEVDFSKIIQDNEKETFENDVFINVNYQEVEDECELKYQKTLTNNKKGTITVISKLDNKNKTLISEAKINLYVLNGISPKLIESKSSNKEGQVKFENLEAGSYRVIAIIDKKYYTKPTYIPWNEVTIYDENLESTIEVLNKIKIR